MATKKTKKTNRTKNRKQKLKQGIKYELYGILLLAIFAIELSQLGEVGFIIHSFFRLLIGTWDFMLSLLGIYFSLHMMIKRELPIPLSLRKLGVLALLFAVTLYNQVKFVDMIQAEGLYNDVNIFSATWQALANERTSGVASEVGGGMLGSVFYSISNFLFADTGTRIVIITLLLIGILLTFNFSYVDFFHKLRRLILAFFLKIKEIIKSFLLLFVTNNKKNSKEINKKKSTKNTIDNNSNGYDKDNNMTFNIESEPIIHDFMDKTNNNHVKGEENISKRKEIRSINDDVDDNQKINLQGISLDKIKEEEENYILPPFKLLNRPDVIDQGNKLRDITNNAKKLEATLESFGVKAKVTQINRGPAVTRYEIQPSIGVKVSKIVNLADDIALSLAAKDIRLEAPIPGKAAIGIEVPNSEIAIVTLREVIETQQFYESDSKLTIALGRDITGEPIIGELNKMPHLLVAGATGSGKSVCINGIITSILYKAKPSEVKFLMVDPKVVELNVYNGIPHLLTPVVTNPKKASKALKMIVSEMENRYEKFAKKGARDIERYNEIIKSESLNNNTDSQVLPYIIVIIDELADLMMVAPNDVEDAIIRLAQKARAAGIHLIVATQRPSVDVITGLIKANIPSRIAFGVSSQIDSRTILDLGGAEKLLGRGDMLYLPVGYTKPIRIQGSYISDVEVEEVVYYVKKQKAVEYQEDLIPDLNLSNEVEVPEDEYFNEAVKIVVENNQASVSLLQRRLRIGYTRAARIIDEMEAKGYVGPYEGSKPRKVLISNEQFNKITS